MFKLAVRILTIALTLVGLGTIAGWVWPLFNSESAPDALRVLNSPDGMFKAAHASWYGGGGLAPYCHDRIFVVPEATAAERVMDNRNVVFEGSCGLFPLQDGQVLNSPDIHWRQASVLTIRFSTEATNRGAATFRLRRSSADGQVAVDFEIVR